MIKTSAELKQKAAGYMLAATNAAKREMNEKKQTKNKQTVTKITSIKKTVTKTTISKQK